MVLDPSAVGTVGDPVSIEWTTKDTLLYAVSVGAGADELAFSTDNTDGVAQQVLPTYPAVMVHRASLQMMKRIGNFHPAMLVHGEQAVSLHRPIPPAGKAVVTATVSDMFDKGRAAVVVVTAAVVMDDEPLCSTRMSMFIRGPAAGVANEVQAPCGVERAMQLPIAPLPTRRRGTKHSSTDSMATAIRSTPILRSLVRAVSTGPSFMACARTDSPVAACFICSVRATRPGSLVSKRDSPHRSCLVRSLQLRRGIQHQARRCSPHRLPIVPLSTTDC
jgi:hypothetical protein